MKHVESELKGVESEHNRSKNPALKSLTLCQVQKVLGGMPRDSRGVAHSGWPWDRAS